MCRQNTNTEKNLCICERSGASELRKCWHFHIKKMLFILIFCWYFRNCVGTNDILVLSAYMYRQISKCTDKTLKKHYWGGGGGQLPPPPPPPCSPPPLLATLVVNVTMFVQISEDYAIQLLSWENCTCIIKAMTVVYLYLQHVWLYHAV